MLTAIKIDLNQKVEGCDALPRSAKAEVASILVNRIKAEKT